MRGHDIGASSGHAWVCDGVKRNRYDTYYLIEFRSGGEGYYSYSNAGYYPQYMEGACYYNYHMNWGWGYDGYVNGSLKTSNGWYIQGSDIPKYSPEYNFRTERKCLYIVPLK